MKDDEKRLSRRELLRDAVGAATFASMGGLAACFPEVGGEWVSVDPLCAEDGDAGKEAAAPRADALASDQPEGADAGGPVSTVVEICRDDSVVEGAARSTIQADVVQAMLDAALSELVQGEEAPWRVLLPDYQPGMRIGLKVNCLNGYVPTSPAIVRAIVTSLQRDLGLDPAAIVVWDRTLSELRQKGRYTQEAIGGATMMGTHESDQDTSGPGYAQPQCGIVAGAVPRLSRILTESTDMTINCPVLKMHTVSGVTAALKNVYGVIDIPYQYHANAGLALAELFNLPLVRKRFRLTIVDALLSTVSVDTAYRVDCMPRRILAARDPIALDSYALDLVNQLRAEKGLKDVTHLAAPWLDRGQALGLGTRRYELRTIRQG